MLHDMHDACEHHGKYFPPDPSLSVGDDHGHELGG